MAAPEYRPEFCEIVRELGKLGKTAVQIAVALEVRVATLDHWRDTHPEFDDAMVEALEQSQAWWETAAQQGLMAGKKFNANLWSRVMESRYPEYNQPKKRELSGPAGGPLKIEDMSDAELARIVAGAAAGGSE